jgi:hypothetical protein
VELLPVDWQVVYEIFSHGLNNLGNSSCSNSRNSSFLCRRPFNYNVIDRGMSCSAGNFLVGFKRGQIQLKQHSGLAYFTHFIGEEICDILDGLGLRLRPKQRY